MRTATNQSLAISTILPLCLVGTHSRVNSTMSDRCPPTWTTRRAGARSSRARATSPCTTTWTAPMPWAAQGRPRRRRCPPAPHGRITRSCRTRTRPCPSAGDQIRITTKSQTATNATRPCPACQAASLPTPPNR